LTYGLRGMAYFCVEVVCAGQDLHSGVMGGTVHEAMNDLVYLMSKLVDVNGKILVPGVCDDVAPLTDEERKAYDSIEFDMEDYRKNVVGCNKLAKGTKADVLMARWRYPTLSLHGIEGAFHEPGSKTVIPCKVSGKFSLRLVPNQDPHKIEQQVRDYLFKLHAERGSPNKVTINNLHSAPAWVTDFNHPHYVAGRKAIKTVFGVEPDLTREGGSIPVCLTFEQLTGKNVMLLPIGAGDDMAHSQNEKINVSNYINGTKLLGAYFYEVAALAK